MGDKITEARQRAGLTPEELAVGCGRSFHTIRGWESGARHPNRRSLNRIATVTGLPVGWFYAERAEAA